MLLLVGLTFIALSSVIAGIALFRRYIRLTEFCNPLLRLDDKTIIITGSSSGIGRATALECASRGARVILACRDIGKAEAVAVEIIENTGNEDVFPMSLDLSSMSSVASFARAFTERYEVVDVLINNAAWMGPRRTTEDGYDLAFQVNFLGPYYLTKLLLLHRARYGVATSSHASRMRVVNVTTSQHALKEGIAELSLLGRLPTHAHDKSRESYQASDWSRDGCHARDWSRDGFQTYAYTKLLLQLFSDELHRITRMKRQQDDNDDDLMFDGIISMAVNPGPTRTGLQSNIEGWLGRVVRLAAKVLFRDAVAGAQSVVYCATVSDAEAEGMAGKTVCDCRIIEKSVTDSMVDRAADVWDTANRMCLDFERENRKT